MRLLLHDHLISDLLCSLSQANGSLMEGFEGRYVVSRGQPHGTGDAFVRIVTLSKHDEPPTAPNGQGLTTDALAHQLDLWIIGTGIAFDHLTSSIHRFA